LFIKIDGICAIDLDTILPCLWISQIKKIPRIYDAHELFCEMKEISSRPGIYKVWKWIEEYSVPRFKHCYTVNHKIAAEFKELYNANFDVIRSIAVLNENKFAEQKEKFILYQGAINEGRSFETLIPAMKLINTKLIICGDGNFMQQAKELSRTHHVEDKVVFKGMLSPDSLQEITSRSYIGITLFEPGAKSNYYSLANRFFDYIHSATPQICVNYPLYQELNKKYDIAVLIDDLKPDSIAKVVNRLLENETAWKSLHENCKTAAKELCWQNEEIILIAFYKKIFG
jgi:glycosyltransferase involved in cell wall biosynthesis